MEQQLNRQPAPVERQPSHQGSAMDMMIHSLVSMVQAGRPKPSASHGSGLLVHDH